MTKELLFIQLVQKLSSKKVFFGHAVVDAEDEAMMVLMHVLQQTVEEILSTGTETVNLDVIEKSKDFVKTRIATLNPMAYILGTVNFCRLNFKCDARALVPRSPIAELILQGFDSWIDINNTKQALDLCTGSGCIGISIAHYYEHIAVDLSDISGQALCLSEENISLHGLSYRVSNIKSDLFNNIHKKYDLIVTNPPYVSDAEYQELPEEFKQEPKLGLVSTQQGLTIPVTILLEASQYLNDNGLLFLEVGYSDTALDGAFSKINIEWIDFLNGGQGVCVFSKEKLVEYHDYFKAFLENKHVI